MLTKGRSSKRSMTVISRVALLLRKGSAERAKRDNEMTGKAPVLGTDALSDDLLQALTASDKPPRETSCLWLDRGLHAGGVGLAVGVRVASGLRPHPVRLLCRGGQDLA
jgi:hypothetical protein